MAAKPKLMIIVTGAAGFIGSCLAKHLLKKSSQTLWVVDDFSKSFKKGNWAGFEGAVKVERNNLIDKLRTESPMVSAIFHLGARTDTTEFNKSIFDRLNVAYSKALWQESIRLGADFIYASSAATFGGGEHGYSDGLEGIELLEPLNPYGASKQEFDLWVKEQKEQPKFWAGLKFFNVYGPNEFHKSRMASVIFHAFNQIQENGSMKLFRSHRDDYSDGGQLRDFIYVKDLISIIDFLSDHDVPSNLYNVGTGQARSFYDLAVATFEALDKPVDIKFIDTPSDIRDKYQYFTEADMSRLLELGFEGTQYNLESGVKDYVTSYLLPSKHF